MWSKALGLGAAIMFCACQMAISAPTLVEHGNGWASRGHFVHDHFGHHRRKVVIIPYPVAWPYPDYDETPIDAYDNGAITASPPASSLPASEAASACHRSIEKFTVPSTEGGTSEITIMRC
jgi:hypothetical protein